MIVEVLLAADEPLAVDRRQEETAAFVVAEELDGQQCEPPRLLEPAQLARRDVKLVEPVGDVGVVVEHAGMTRSASAPGAVQTAVGTRERSQQELCAGARCGHEIVPLEPPSSLG